MQVAAMLNYGEPQINFEVFNDIENLIQAVETTKSILTKES